jgi:ribose-phosphate pyrophosphokinase
MNESGSSHMNDSLKVFAGSSNQPMAEEICDCLGIPLSKLEINRFSNDNLHVQIQENVRERDVFVIQSFSAPVSEHIMELFIILDALRSASAHRITAVIPYFSYARSDKKDAPRISIAGRLMADLLVTAGANRVLTMDLHADQVHGFFSVPVDHLTAIPTISTYFRDMLDMGNCVACATDAGGTKRVQQFARRLNIPMAFVEKRRDKEHVEQGLVVGEVKGKDAIIFEDEIAAGSTLTASVETLYKAGASTIYAGATHGILCGPAIQRLKCCHVQDVAVTNTVLVPEEKRIEKLTVLSVASLFAEAIKRIHTGESVGSLFT